MNGPGDRAAPTIVPTLRYDDAPAAVEWLCRAFGFAIQLVVPGARRRRARRGPT